VRGVGQGGEPGKRQLQGVRQLTGGEGGGRLRVGEGEFD
jgi:hypothetical protein